VKVIIFSEWEGMLDRVREHADEHGIGYAWHTGSVPQQRRRAEILAFRQDPTCRLFLSTDSGGVGLNLQHASVVINCDLPWNPAKLEQRIARAWRKNQLRPVTVVNLVAEGTIEHSMLGSLANKQELARGVLDGLGDLTQVKLKRGRQELLKRLEQALAATSVPAATTVVPAHARPAEPSSDPAAAFAAAARQRFGSRLTRCEETWLAGSDEPVIIAIVQGSAAEQKPVLDALLNDTPWRGSRPPLHVLDASAWETLQSLARAGLLTLHARAVRPLLASSDGADKPKLSEEQRAKIDSRRALALRKARAARALLAADLADEAVPALREAVLAQAQAADIAQHRPESATLAEALRPPCGAAWSAEIRSAVQALDAKTITSDFAIVLVEWLLQS
jgi:hypothetical protein